RRFVGARDRGDARTLDCRQVVRRRSRSAWSLVSGGGRGGRSPRRGAGGDPGPGWGRGGGGGGGRGGGGGGGAGGWGRGGAGWEGSGGRRVRDQRGHGGRGNVAWWLPYRDRLRVRRRGRWGVRGQGRGERRRQHGRCGHRGGSQCRRAGGPIRS